MMRPWDAGAAGRSLPARGLDDPDRGKVGVRGQRPEPWANSPRMLAHDIAKRDPEMARDTNCRVWGLLYTASGGIDMIGAIEVLTLDHLSLGPFPMRQSFAWQSLPDVLLEVRRRGVSEVEAKTKICKAIAGLEIFVRVEVSENRKS